MSEVDDKTIAMDLLQQAADRTSRQEALSTMMSTTPRGAVVNWVAVRAKLQNFIANLTLPPSGEFAMSVAQVEKEDADLANSSR